MEIKFKTPEQEKRYYQAKNIAWERGVTLEQLICPFMPQEFADLDPRAMCAVINTEPELMGGMRTEVEKEYPRVHNITVPPKNFQQFSKFEFEKYGNLEHKYYRQASRNRFLFQRRAYKTVFYRMNGNKLPGFMVDCAKKCGGQHKKVDGYEYIVIDFEQMERFWAEASSDFIII